MYVFFLQDFDQLDRVKGEIEEIFSLFHASAPLVTKIENLMPILIVNIPAHIIPQVRLFFEFKVISRFFFIK